MLDFLLETFNEKEDFFIDFVDLDCMRRFFMVLR